jgi:hypothetical protein
VCAEYSYGGIPEWLPLKYPDMNMRRPDRQWLDVMSAFVNETVSYLRSNQLWAYQGGPIILAQIENELGEEGTDVAFDPMQVDDDSEEFIFEQQQRQGAHRNASLQDYANWCGKLAQRLEPNVTWTMCNGLSANNTIDTFNGDYLVTHWLESHGDSGRIQISQPALYTEDEGMSSEHIATSCS